MTSDQWPPGSTRNGDPVSRSLGNSRSRMRVGTEDRLVSSHALEVGLLCGPTCETRSMGASGYVGSIVSIVAGCLGLIWPDRVTRTIGLRIPGGLGKSEVRATYGGLFIGMGLAVTLIANDDAALVLGAAWGGAFVARAISFFVDGSRSKENVVGLVIEALVAILLILA